ncbi:MAG: hypothetical protein EZS28_045119 [Streblomastix strix]|uniref:Uncharacterized protein n=1 Tax=Streblomastix strix TaxID=222440 RepID=A0A5J4TLR8_9EUKA|nr:MAG: hypothetical protein EZS28_045119 [Streblomastix strix]
MTSVRRRPPAFDRDEQEPDEDDENIPQILKKKRKAEEEEKSKDNSKLVNGIIYTLFGFIVLTASLMPFSMKFMPKNKVVIELEKKGNAYEPFFSQKHKLFYYVDTATARKLAKSSNRQLS